MPNNKYTPPQEYLPTLEQIQAECREIQKTWSPAEERNRRGDYVRHRFVSDSPRARYVRFGDDVTLNLEDTDR